MFGNGEIYTGLVKWPSGNLSDLNNRSPIKHGWGENIKPSGQSYTGNFVDDKRNGYGTLHYASGDIYEGNFSQN